jgi:hypothetical protein
MKTKPIIAALAALIAASVMLCGCVPQSRIKPGSDILVVNAEQLAKEATATLDDFISYVDRNAFILGSDVIAARDLAATSGPVYIRELRAATRAYKGSRTDADKTKLQLSLDALRGLLETVREHYQPQPKNV